MGKMIFTRAGAFTSVQDTGRFGYRKFGVPVSGAMDLQSAGLANILVNNTKETPVFEITLSGPEIQFDGDALIALTGANLSPHIDGVPLPMNTAFQIRAGQALAFGKPKYGVRTYLAVKGGFVCEKILNSHSQYNPVTSSSRIEKGFEFNYHSWSGRVPNTALKPDPDHFNGEYMEAASGPEYELLNDEMKRALSTGKIIIGENNRMGYQLLAHLPSNQMSIITAPVIPGTVQLTPSGKLIVLMRDGQVTGGYPRILQLTGKSINRLAQKRSGQKVMFKLI